MTRYLVFVAQLASRSTRSIPIPNSHMLTIGSLLDDLDLKSASLAGDVEVCAPCTVVSTCACHKI